MRTQYHVILSPVHFRHVLLALALLAACAPTLAQGHEPTTATDGGVKIHNTGFNRFFRPNTKARPTEREGEAIRKRKKSSRYSRKETKVYKRHTRNARQRESARRRMRGPKRQYLEVRQ